MSNPAFYAVSFAVILCCCWTIITLTQHHEHEQSSRRQEVDALVRQSLLKYCHFSDLQNNLEVYQPYADCSAGCLQQVRQAQKPTRLDDNAQDQLQQQDQRVMLIPEAGEVPDEDYRIDSVMLGTRPDLLVKESEEKDDFFRFHQHHSREPSKHTRSLQSFVALQLDIQKDVADMKNTITLLQTRVSQLEQDMVIQQLAQKLAPLRDAVTELAFGNSSLESTQNLQVEEQKPLSQASIATLTNDISVLKQNVNVLMSDRNDFNTRVAPLETCLNSITKSVAVNDSTIANYVLPTDTVLVRPNSLDNFTSPLGSRSQQNIPLIAPIVAYTWRTSLGFTPDQYEFPIYQDMNRNRDAFWDTLVDELLFSRVPLALLHGRGCYNKKHGLNGPGSLCPRLLSRFVDAVDRAGVRDVIRVGMFDATGAYTGQVNSTRMDLSKKKNWDYFWSYNYRIWFDTIPQDMWYLLDGKPVIMAWTLADAFFQNQEGNASRMLAWIASRFKKRYGVVPAFVLQDTWFENDSTITTEHATGRHGWFKPQFNVSTSIYSYQTFNGATWGVSTPGYRNGYSQPNCGSTCREVSRNNGTTLTHALQMGSKSKMIFLEGWMDMVESAGFYRSDRWDYPSQYINIVRRFANPEPETLRFEAEGADAFYDTTPENLGLHYANRSLDVGALANGTGYYVGWTVSGEWLEYQHVYLGCGTYRFTARVATKSEGKQIRLDLGDLPSIELPYTGGLEIYDLFHLGEIRLKGGEYNLRLVFESTSGLNVDWFFLKRSEVCYCELDQTAY